MKKQQKENEEIARVIEREQIISYKKRPSGKPVKDSDDQIQSAQSLKSGVFSEESSSSRAAQDIRFSKKNPPLPELNRERKKFIGKNLGPVEVKQVNNYLEKQVRQHDNLVLKQKNNHLTTQNMKLKTKIMALEKENQRLLRSTEEQGQKIKPPGFQSKDSRLKGNEVMSLKMTMKNLRKQLDDQKKQNQKIKWSIKFTRISELECQRDEILNECGRLRQILEDQLSKRVHLKAKEHGLSHLEQKIHSLGEKNFSLMKQNSELQSKIRKIEDSSKKFKQSTQNEKNLNRMLFNANRVIKEKQKQIQSLKIVSTQAKIESIGNINTAMQIRSSKQVEKGKSKEKKVMSRSAQKYRREAPKTQGPKSDCKSCDKYKSQIKELEKKIKQFEVQLKIAKETVYKNPGIADFRKEQIDIADKDEAQTLGRFLTFRFKAHHLSFDQAEKYLVNGEISDETLKQQMSLEEMAQSLVAEPFSVISSRYLEIFLMKIFYKKECQGQLKKLKLDEGRKLKKQQILNNFRTIIKPYEILPQEKQEEMFIQVAELITNYHQHILTALNKNRNGEGTIGEKDMITFFNEIQLEKDFTDFIISQIILESLDLQHLNFYTMFQIFYMPSQGGEATVVAPDQPNKKKFQVDQTQIVKEEDQQYEESRSHLDTRQKTQSRREEDSEMSDPIENSHHHSVGGKKEMQEQVMEEQEEDQILGGKFENEKIKKKKQEEDYQQLFEEQKMDQLPEQQKADEEQAVDDEIKPYMMEQIENQYQDDADFQQ